METSRVFALPVKHLAPDVLLYCQRSACQQGISFQLILVVGEFRHNSKPGSAHLLQQEDLRTLQPVGGDDTKIETNVSKNEIIFRLDNSNLAKCVKTLSEMFCHSNTVSRVTLRKTSCLCLFRFFCVALLLSRDPKPGGCWYQSVSWTCEYRISWIIASSHFIYRRRQ